jgi:hypothetical protein
VVIDNRRLGLALVVLFSAMFVAALIGILVLN